MFFRKRNDIPSLMHSLRTKVLTIQHPANPLSGQRHSHNNRTPTTTTTAINAHTKDKETKKYAQRSNFLPCTTLHAVQRNAQETNQYPSSNWARSRGASAQLTASIWDGASGETGDHEQDLRRGPILAGLVRYSPVLLNHWIREKVGELSEERKEGSQTGIGGARVGMQG